MCKGGLRGFHFPCLGRGRTGCTKSQGKSSWQRLKHMQGPCGREELARLRGQKHTAKQKYTHNIDTKDFLIPKTYKIWLPTKMKQQKDHACVPPSCLGNKTWPLSLKSLYVPLGSHSLSIYPNTVPWQIDIYFENTFSCSVTYFMAAFFLLRITILSFIPADVFFHFHCCVVFH